MAHGDPGRTLKSDYIPTDDENAKPFLAAMAASLGAIRGMRDSLKRFRAELMKESPNAFTRLTPDQRAHARRLNARQVELRPLSDAMMITCTLKPNDDHLIPMLGVYDVLMTCMQQMLTQLAIEHPIRGGLDIGTGIVVDGEFFGAALVKAHRLESDCGYPRLVIGNDFVSCLDSESRPKGPAIEQRYVAEFAAKCRTFIARDEDGKWILDYAGQAARQIWPEEAVAMEFTKARAFAQQSRDGYRRDNPKLFARYSSLVRYLDSRAPLWT